ncbi:hypothetical protein JHK87_001179 [Glycine soja]|nr:hypothetical protein JHK87_001179 [Glycine soja]
MDYVKGFDCADLLAGENLHGIIQIMHLGNPIEAWISKKLESILVADPNISYSTMKQVLLDKHGLEPSNLMQLYREKTKVHETTRGVHALSYNDLPA